MHYITLACVIFFDISINNFAMKLFLYNWHQALRCVFILLLYVALVNEFFRTVSFNETADFTLVSQLGV